MAVDGHLVRPWSHAADIEESPVLARRYRVFRRDEVGDVPAALLHLLDDGHRIYVANIVPTEVGELSIGQYNEILVEFAERFGDEAARQCGLEALLGSDVVDVGAELDEATFKRLIAFSRAANRATGSSHPMDRERWHDFMILLHRSGRELEPSVLQEFLMLDGWSESVAWDLVLQYEFGMGLLRRVGAS
jgi:hypothetical protein